MMGLGASPLEALAAQTPLIASLTHSRNPVLPPFHALPPELLFVFVE